MLRRSDVEYIPFLVPVPGRRYDITGAGAAVAGVAQAVGSVTAAGIQASAANHAADLTSQSAANSLAFNKNVFDTDQSNQAPWLQAGQGALSQLTQGTAAGGSLVTPYGQQYQTPAAYQQAAYDSGPAFQAPSTVDESNDPGYQARMAAGEQALQRGAAAAGGATSGGTLKALTRYGQDYASNEYTNVYNRALQGYQTNQTNSLNAYNANATSGLNAYNTNVSTGLNAYNTQANAYNTGQSNTYSRLAALSGVGQAAASGVAAAGSAAAANNASINSSSAAQQASLLTQGANAASAGVIGVGNAITNGVNNSQNQQSLLALQNGSYGGGSSYTAGSSYNVPAPAETNDEYGYG